ncbi:MAG TPA: 3-hydroxyacyl-ACP dehydratase [Flavobacteriales bacterium]|nr:3-hydroxyacyl-ACP dehydratase [Flavobacteriales bacterium]HIA10768.1 3-hydroxyacyl-ACP dehydratase [Flavobacteriales bacterium]HIO73584.1 3-hydroxyacyl-ACP dehydratase [Flavobacteriales bacterium]
MLLSDFYTILNSNSEDSSVRTEVELNADHDIFAGHFPNMPVVPGVCQVQMTKEILSKELGVKLRLTSAVNIKFLAIINPEQNRFLQFDLTYSEENGRIKSQNVISHDGKVFFKFKGYFVETD